MWPGHQSRSPMRAARLAGDEYAHHHDRDEDDPGGDGEARLAEQVDAEHEHAGPTVASAGS